MRTVALLAAFGLMALTSCADSDPTQPLVQASAEFWKGGLASDMDHARPFKMDMLLGADYSQGVCTAEVPMGDPTNSTVTVELPLLVPAWGTASHMGRVTQHIWHAECGFDPDLGALVQSGWFQIWAANGDRVDGTWTGTSYFDGTLIVHGVINGGDGRFANATGQMEVEGYIAIEPVTQTLLRSTGGAFSGTGWIAY